MEKINFFFIQIFTKKHLLYNLLLVFLNFHDGYFLTV